MPDKLFSLTFPRKLRICSKGDFARIFDGQQNNLTKKIKTDYFVLLFMSNVYTYPRLGIIISKKNVSKAFMRNRIKRVVRESFRLNKRALNCFDIVCIIYKKINQLSNFELNNILKQEWEKLTALQQS